MLLREEARYHGPDYCKSLPLLDGLTFPESGFPLSARMPIPPSGKNRPAQPPCPGPSCQGWGTEHVHQWRDEIIPQNASLPKTADRQQFEILVLRALAVLLENTPIRDANRFLASDSTIYREIMDRLKR